MTRLSILIVTTDVIENDLQGKVENVLAWSKKTKCSHKESNMHDSWDQKASE